MSRTQATLWIVHRDERLRAALRRLAGAGDEALLGAPDAASFRDAPAPRVVLLGLAGDFEAELEFAHRLGERHPAVRWLVLVDALDRTEAERLFDALPADWLEFPPTAAELRLRLRGAAARRRQEELSKRSLRDALSARFARCFADLELPEVLRAIDPRLAGVPLLVLGEPGTGRGLLARYVHAFGGGGDAWHEVECRGIAGPGELRAALAEADGDGSLRDAVGVTVCLRDVDALPARRSSRCAPGWSSGRRRPSRAPGACAGSRRRGTRSSAGRRRASPPSWPRSSPASPSGSRRSASAHPRRCSASRRTPCSPGAAPGASGRGASRPTRSRRCSSTPGPGTTGSSRPCWRAASRPRRAILSAPSSSASSSAARR